MMDPPLTTAEDDEWEKLAEPLKKYPPGSIKWTPWAYRNFMNIHLAHKLLNWRYGANERAVRRAEPLGLPETFSGRGILLERSGPYPMAERPGLSEMPQADGVRANAALVSMRSLSSTNLGYGRDDVSQKPGAAAEMVLGDVLDGCFAERGVDAQSSKAPGNRVVRDGLAYGA